MLSSVSHGPPKDPASFVFWDAINNASIINRHPANHIRGLKWGRIDFLTELELTTRWMIFKCVERLPSQLLSIEFNLYEPIYQATDVGIRNQARHGTAVC